jgi:hypothetical protein
MIRMVAAKKRTPDTAKAAGSPNKVDTASRSNTVKMTTAAPNLLWLFLANGKMTSLLSLFVTRDR